MTFLAIVLVGGGFSVFLNMQGDLQAQLIGLVMMGIGFLVFKGQDNKK
jgi:hypothetical protein